MTFLNLYKSTIQYGFILNCISKWMLNVEPSFVSVFGIFRFRFQSIGVAHIKSVTTKCRLFAYIEHFLFPFMGVFPFAIRSIYRLKLIYAYNFIFECFGKC